LPVAVPILFPKKKDGGLRLSIDYRALDKVTVKNRYPLPFMSEMLDCVREARIFSKLDLRGVYNLIRTKEGKECKTAFQTRYGQFQCEVLPFGLTNAPATFQSYIDDCLRPYIDDFAVSYPDDILIYSASRKEHEAHVRQVMQQLKECGLYCKAEKGQFGVSEVGFLRCVITPEAVGMESDRISTIEDWPTPKSVRDGQVLLGFTNFYRRFVRNHAKLTLPMSELLKKPETSPRGKKGTHPAKWQWMRQAEVAFRKLKRTLTKAPILQHFDPAKPIILQTDPSGFAITGILNQYDGFGVLRPVNFYSRMCSSAKQNYDTYVRELLAIVETLKHW
jgi:hypothetical protein